MRRAFAVLLVSLSAALAGLVGPAQAQNYIALVIGNAEYEETRWKLANPAREAKLVADALTEAGYDVELVTNATEQEMTDAARRMRNRMRDAGPSAVGMFYYAGHGMEAEGLNYLIPIEINATTQQDVAADSVRLGRLLDIVGSAPSKAVIVVLNACRNAPLQGATYSVETPGMAPEGRRRNFLIAYATARRAPAYDFWPPDGAPPADGLSPYGRAFISRLSSPEPAELVFSRIGADVDDFTGGAQQPFVESGYRSSSAENDLYIVPRTTSGTGPGLTPVVELPPEAPLWSSLIAANASACDYADFLTTYPDSVYAPLARTKAADCRRAAPTPDPVTPTPTPTPPAPTVVDYAGQQISLYYRDTDASRGVANDIRTRLREIGIEPANFAVIAGVCDPGNAGVEYNVVDYKSEWSGTPRLDKLLSSLAGVDVALTPRSSPWGQGSDVVIALCGMEEKRTAPVAPPSTTAPTRLGAMDVAIYYRDTVGSKAVADTIKAGFEALGASVPNYEPIYSVCDTDRADARFNIIDYRSEWAGSAELEALIGVTDDASVQITPRLTTWEGQSSDVVVALCGMDETEGEVRTSDLSNTILSIYHRDTDRSRAVTGELQRKLAGVGITPRTVDVIAGVCDAASSTINFMDYLPSVAGRAGLDQIINAVQSVGEPITARESSWSAQSSEIVIALCAMPESDTSSAAEVGTGAVPEVAIYYRDTPRSREVAGRLRDEFEAIGAYVPFYEEIYGVCDAGYADASFNIADFLPAWSSSRFLTQAREVLARSGQSIQVRQSNWAPQSSDMVIALCGMPADSAGAATASWGDSQPEIAIYYRDTNRSRRAADSMKRDLERRGLTVARYEPIAGVCNVASSNVNFADYKSNWAGSEFLDEIAQVTSYADVPINIRRSEWSAQSSDLVIALCGMPE